MLAHNCLKNTIKHFNSVTTIITNRELHGLVLVGRPLDRGDFGRVAVPRVANPVTVAHGADLAVLECGDFPARTVRKNVMFNSLFFDNK